MCSANPAPADQSSSPKITSHPTTPPSFANSALPARDLKAFVALAKSGNSPFAAMGDMQRKYFGVQFHPEFKSTPWDGHPLFNAFIRAAVEHQTAVKKASK